MIVFYIVVAVLTLVAIAIIVPPLLKKNRFDQDTNLRLRDNVSAAQDRLGYLDRELSHGKIDDTEYQIARADIEKNLALDLDKIDADKDNVDEQQSIGSSPVMAVVVALAVPLFAGYLYLTLGTPDAIENQAVATTESAESAQPPPSTEDINAMVEGLAKRLNESEPDNVEGWYRLAQSYLVLGRYEEAIPAAERVRELSNDDPAALLLHASALSGNRDGQIDDEVEKIVLDVIKRQPDNAQALWMAGMAARQREQLPAAIDYWNRLLPLLEQNPEQQQELRTLIATTEAQASTGAQAGADSQGDSEPVESESTQTNNDQNDSATENNEKPVATSTSRLVVNVSLEETLLEDARPDDTVFVFARALDGPPMPLAVARKKVSDLPLTVQLDDSSAMLPAMTLSKFSEVLVGARISASGDPIGQTGDLEGSVSPVSTDGETQVNVVINSVRQ